LISFFQTIKNSGWGEGTRFGGAVAVDAERHERFQRDFDAELATAKRELTALAVVLATEERRRHKVNAERDFLRTRIEILEQAVVGGATVFLTFICVPFCGGASAFVSYMCSLLSCSFDSASALVMFICVLCTLRKQLSPSAYVCNFTHYCT
jgi:hypothetical protein